MHKSWEEILEATWTDNQEALTLAEIRSRCPIEIPDGELELLERRGLVRREADTLVLTIEGWREARSVVRRHRLAETLFATILNLDPAKREEIACEVEHTLLPEVEEAICILLGHPTVGPDNQPIPPGRCCSAGRTTASSLIVSLTDLAPGERGRVTFIKPADHERLHRLASFGIQPGTVVEVHQRYPAYCLRYEGTELAINEDTASDIYVTKING